MISDQVRSVLASGQLEPVTAILLKQLLDLNGVEATANELGYTPHFDKTSGLVTFYRERKYPEGTMIDEFQVLPMRPHWYERSGFVRMYDGLADLPAKEDIIFIEALGGTTREMRLSVHYSHSLGKLCYYRTVEVTCPSEFMDFLRNPELLRNP